MLANRKRPKYRTQIPPVCPVHRVLMVVRSTRITVRYYYCPVKGCKCSKCMERK